MLTVKLCRGQVTKIIEAKEVNVYPSGKAEGSDSDPSKRTGEVQEISILRPDGRTVALYVSWPLWKQPRPDGWVDEVDFYDVAYIENAHGATTETVRAY